MEGLIGIHRIVVHEPKVSTNRIRIGYSLVRRGSKTETVTYDLRFDHDVLSTDSEVDSALARMVGLQPLVNMGLFAERIETEFPLDPLDIAFLEQLLRAISKEILINRVLDPHQSAVAERDRPAFRKRKTYADVELDIATQPPGRIGSRSTPDSVGVLLTAAPEALLNAAVFRDIGAPVAGVLVSTGGAEQRAADDVAARLVGSAFPVFQVATNLDAVLLSLGEHVRAIHNGPLPKRGRGRFACYVHGASIFALLPLLRARGIGLLALPDRYPGQLPEPFHGASHYGGRYEHTRYFHDLLTRYLLERGPAVDVFSPLAPLGEMAVLRVLARGFPDWLGRWMPCPTPKTTTRKVSACGECEACRRAAAQLLSIEIDPARVGLGADALKALFREGLKAPENDPEVVDEVRVRLARFGWMLGNGNGGSAPAPTYRREVERLRFDNRMTFIDTIPKRHRARFYRRLLEFIPGALIWTGDEWTDFDLLASKEIEREKVLFAPSLGHAA
ncbi:MAG: hypothetical protein U0610_12575 [bacterium]